MTRRVLFLGADLAGVSWRFRVAQYLPALRQAGMHADVADLHTSLAQRLRILASASHYDVMFLHRVLLTLPEQQLLRRRARRYVFDFDDAIMFRDSAADRFDSRQRLRRFARIVRGADAVVAGNRYLADWAGRYSAGVSVVPTGLDLTPYPTTPAAVAEPVVGWIGTRANLMYLRNVGSALARLATRRPELRLKVVSDGTVDLPAVPVIEKRWSLVTEVDDLRSFQVGIMPLPDDPWTRGKCALKILQYFAAGVPVVCSPVGANLQVVEHGRNGFFASHEGEWVDRIEALLGDAALRRRFGARGREVVAERFSLQATLPGLLRALRSSP